MISSPRRKLAAAFLTGLVLAGACSTDDGPDDATPSSTSDASDAAGDVPDRGDSTPDGADPTGEDATGEDATGGGAEGDGDEADPAPARDAAEAFRIPEDLLSRVDAAGLPVVAVEYPSQPPGVAWPTEAWPEGELPAGVSAEVVTDIVDRAFGELSDDNAYIKAVLAVSGGRLVVEEYHRAGPEDHLHSWSMAKSITSALVGIQVREGSLDPFAPAPVPEWSAPDDPRNGITTDMLLRMSSGLEWTEDYVRLDSDVLSILVGDGRADRAAYTASKPLEADPDTMWEYSTGTSNILARLVADQVGYGDDFTDWIDDELFEPLGITSVEHDLDERGVINGGSWVNLTARDFARFGYLYLRGGQWDDQRILPESWVDYSRLPTPTTDGPVYGAQWWLDDRPGTFHASGFDGQTITVVPDLDLVVVVLSDVPDGRDNQIRLALIDAFDV